MAENKRGFYKARPTLAELYAEQSTLFSGLQLPTGVTAATLQGMILVQFGELDTIFETAQNLETYLGLWSVTKLPGWSRIASTLTEEYDPLHNYDRTEEESETLRTQGGSQFAGKTEQSGSSEEKTELQGFNSDSFVPSEKITTEPDLINKNSSSTQSTGAEDRGREVHAYGNIGVTTAQAMAEAELRLRQMWTLYGVILEDFRREICVGVW